MTVSASLSTRSISATASIALSRGATRSFLLQFWSHSVASRTALDLTGAVVRWAARDRAGEVVIEKSSAVSPDEIELAAQSGATLGQATLHLYNGDTEELEAGTYTFDLWVTLPNGGEEDAAIRAGSMLVAERIVDIVSASNPGALPTDGDPALTMWIAPGEDKAAEIMAAISAMRAVGTRTKRAAVKLMRGSYTLESRILVSGTLGADCFVDLEAGPAELVAEFTGGADDPANAMLGIEGAYDLATLDTLLTADVSAGARSITVASIGLAAAGTWIAIEGQNAGGQNYAGDFGNSDGAPNIITRDIVQVLTAVGNTITFARPLTHNHATPGTKANVRAIKPVIGFEVHGGAWRGATAPSITADAVYSTLTVDGRVDGVMVENVSRFAIEAKTVHGFGIDGFVSLGTNNAWLHFESVAATEVENVRGLDDVARFHPSGYPRDLITTIGRCQIDFSDIDCAGGCIGGIFLAGGGACKLTNVLVRNMVLTQPEYVRWCAAPEINATPASFYFHALGIGMGNGDLAYAEFAHALQIDNVVIDATTFEVPDTWPTAPPSAFAAYVHDTMRCQIGQLSVVNRGTHKPRIGGVRFSDTTGQLPTLLVKGLNYGIFTQNVGADFKIADYRYDPVCGTQVVTGPAIWLDHTNNAMKGIVIERMQSQSDFGSGQAFLSLGTAWLANESANPDRRHEIRELERDDGRWRDVTLGVQVAAFAMWDVVELDPTYTGTGLPRYRTPVVAAGYEARLAVVVAVHNSNIISVAELGEQSRATAKVVGALVPGDQLVYDPANPRMLKVDNAAARPVAKALYYRASAVAAAANIGSA